MDSMGLILLARAIHVVAGVFWAGFIFIGLVLMPAVAAQSPQAAGALRGVMARLGPRVVGPAALLTVLAGGYLMFVLHPGDQSATGTALKIGAVAAIATIIVGAALINPTVRRMAEADEPTQLRLRKRLALVSRCNGALMLVAVLAMATARYL